MTTVAWDGRTLAADRQVSAGNDIVAYVVKVRRCADGRLIGACGSLDVMAALLDWLEQGGERPDCMGDKNAAEAIEIMPDGAVWNHLQHARVRLVSGPTAIGSGSGYARAAMECGKPAAEAVKIAAKFDAGTGGKIDALHLRK